MIKKLLLSFAFCPDSFTVNAQRIAIVDINAVLTEMSDYKAVQKELDEVASTWRQGK